MGSFSRSLKTVSTDWQPIRILHLSRTTLRNNVIRRKTQGEQGQKRCSIHSHGRRSVLFAHVFRRHFTNYFAFAFCLFVLGASGTGRTTFVNTLCESEVLGHKVSDSPETAHVEEGIRIKPVNVGASQSFATLHNFQRLSLYFQSWKKMAFALP